MKKSVIKKLIIAVVLLFLSFMGFQIVQKLQYKEQVQQKLSTLPEFSFQTLEGRLLRKRTFLKITKQFLSISIPNATIVSMKPKTSASS